MTVQSKFLAVCLVMFSLPFVFRVAPVAAITELILLLALVHFVCRSMWRR